MDPLSAIGLASNIVQFIHFGCSLIRKSSEVHRSASGAEEEHVEIELIATTLSNHCDRLGQAPSFLNQPPERELLDLAEECKKVAGDLVSLVRKIRSPPGIDGKRHRWKSFRQALTTIMKKEEIQSLQQRLRSLQEQIDSQLLFSLSYEQQRIRRSLENIRELQVAQGTRYYNVDEVVKKICSLSENLAELRRSDWITRSISIFYSKTDSLLEGSEKCAVAALNLQREQELLDSLRFPEMMARETSIAEADPSTFSWLFEGSGAESHNDASITRLMEWLPSASNVFWISGKPGSGKSTLMRHIYEHPTTRKKLLLWAQGSKLVTASFYFWYAGTDMQKSRKGLFQSLLHEILTENTELIPELCPTRWGRTNSQASARTDQSWSLKELTEPFQKLKDQVSFQKRFCFFIDGLDEYKGDHDQFEIIEVIQDMSSSPHIKLCLASRPWNIFEDAFGKDQNCKLYLQDLTKHDIECYTRNKLYPHVNYSSSEDAFIQFQQLVYDVVSKAQGVFLWVILVVRSLREGLSNGDDISMLKKRLDSLPSDLEPFFQHILNSVDPIYKDIMAKTFLIALGPTAESFANSLGGDFGLSLVAYSFLEEIDPDFALSLPIGCLSEADILNRQGQMRRRLNGRYKGLLEVWDSGGGELYSRYTVQWLHRTVRDFLATGGMQDMLRSYLPPRFSISAALGRAFLAQIKTMAEDFNAKLQILGKILAVARNTEVEAQQCDHAMFDELGKVMDFLGLPQPSLAERSVRADLKLYVKYRLRKDASWRLPQEGPSLLVYAMDWTPYKLHSTDGLCLTYMSDEPQDPVGMMQTLLENGADPNQDYDGETPWLLLFRYIPSWAESKSFEAFLTIMGLFIAKGADVAHLVMPGAFGRTESIFPYYILPILVSRDFGVMDTQWNSSAILEKLFDHGLNPNHGYGGLPLWWQIVNEILEASNLNSFAFDTVRVCLRYGADPSWSRFRLILNEDCFGRSQLVELKRLADMPGQPYEEDDSRDQEQENAATSRTWAGLLRTRAPNNERQTRPVNKVETHRKDPYVQVRDGKHRRKWRSRRQHKEH